MKPSEIALRQLESARAYTWTLLEDLDDDQWFEQPGEMVSHIAWQVGHITMSQYALTLLRIRGKEPEDQEFITNAFFKFFKKTSTAQSRELTPSVDEIKQAFQAVYDRALLEVPGYSDELLAESLPDPTFATPTKLGSILFASHHEMLHTGQIGVLRRLMGKPPVR
jgi:uncharacterized damage-inducible protein DinB